MTERRHRHPSPRAADQRGGVLIVTMVLIFVVSILGASTMRGSTMERRMASNAVQTSTAFQASESVTEAMLNEPQNLGDAFELNGAPLAVSVDLQLDDEVDVDGELEYVGNGAALGYSLGEGSNNFMALRYDAHGTAEITSVRSYSRVTQGAYRVVPAP